MISEEAQRMRELLKSMPRDSDASLEERRATAEAMWPSFAAEPDATFEVVDASGVPAEWIRPAGADAARIVLYLHGGGYTQGSIATHRQLAAHIAGGCGRTGLIVDYRLAPEHPFPAGLDDAFAAYGWLLNGGFDASAIAVGGDSAGGGLTLALALRLRDEGVALPGALFCLSPWTDLAMTGDTLVTKKSVDLFIDPDDRTNIGMYLGGGAGGVKDPYVSPLYGDFAGLPRLLIQVGGDEVLLDDSARVTEKAQAAGVDVTLEVWPEMQHVWQALVGSIPEATDAVAKIGAWLG